MPLSASEMLALSQRMFDEDVILDIVRLVRDSAEGLSSANPIHRDRIERETVDAIQGLLAGSGEFANLATLAAAGAKAAGGEKLAAGEAVAWQCRDTTVEGEEWQDCPRRDVDELSLPWMEYRELGVLRDVHRGYFRPQFEAWMTREGYAHELLWDDRRNCYAREFPEGRWKAWQAAMAANSVHQPVPADLMALWPDAYAAYKGVFDTPQDRRRIDDEYARDARNRLREFNDGMVEAIARTKAKTGNATGVVWPKEKSVGRVGDMAPLGQSGLRVGMDGDCDVYVEVWDRGTQGDGSDFCSAALEFCNPGGGGGGQSPNTRKALIALMVAIEEDNERAPHKAWPQPAIQGDNRAG